MQFRVGHDCTRFFGHLFSNSRILLAAAVGNLMRDSDRELDGGSSARAAEADADEGRQEQLWAVCLDLGYADFGDESKSDSDEPDSEEQRAAAAAGSQQSGAGSSGDNASQDSLQGRLFPPEKLGWTRRVTAGCRARWR